MQEYKAEIKKLEAQVAEGRATEAKLSKVCCLRHHTSLPYPAGLFSGAHVVGPQELSAQQQAAAKVDAANTKTIRRLEDELKALNKRFEVMRCGMGAVVTKNGLLTTVPTDNSPKPVRQTRRCQRRMQRLPS